MAKQDIQTIIGSSISKDETLLKNFKSIKSCFVGWVESYNETSGTVNVQPAIQDFISNDEQSGKNYRNSPLLVNVWVLGTFKSTAIEKGDKAVCFVLDQKSNDFFKCIYDSGISLGFQTFKPKTSAQKNICDCVCIILGDASFQEVYEAISAIDTALENKADIDGTYPDMTVGKATQATEDGEGNNIFETYTQKSTLPLLAVSLDTVLTTEGWHKLIQVNSNATSGICIIEQTYNATTAQNFVFSYSISRYTNIAQITVLSACSPSSVAHYKLRCVLSATERYIELYYPFNTANNISVSAYSINQSFATIVLSDDINTLTGAISEIEILDGINTTGNIYINGTPVS